jgi:structural maintenance of chromosome 2
LETQIELKQASIRDEENRAATLKAHREELKASLEGKTKEVEELNAAYAQIKAQHETYQQRFNSKQELLQTLQTGLADSANTSGGGYLGQLAEAKARVVQAQTEEEQAHRQTVIVEKELKETQEKWKKVEKEAGDGARTLEKKKQELEKMKRSLASMSWSDEKEAAFMSSLKHARDEVRSLTEVSSDVSRSCIL